MTDYIQEGKSNPIPDQVKTIIYSMLIDICSSALLTERYILQDQDADIIYDSIKSLLDRAVNVRVRFDVEMEKERRKEQE